MPSQKPPSQWEFRRFANVGTSEEFVRQFLELFEIVGATLIADAQKTRVTDAIGDVLNDGLTPAFLELQKVRAAKDDLPVLDRLQMFENLARKLWKAYKDLMQRAATCMDFNIGFLFQRESKFEEGLKKFREDYPSAAVTLEAYLRERRRLWQNDLSDFRNKFLEHREGDRATYEKFYKRNFAEALFTAVWKTIVEILAMLLAFRLPPGIYLVEHDPASGQPWPRRFRFEINHKLPEAGAE